MVLRALGPSPVDIDEIIHMTGVESRKVHIVLLKLDLAGKLQRHGQRLVSLVDDQGLRYYFIAGFHATAFPATQR